MTKKQTLEAAITLLRNVAFNDYAVQSAIAKLEVRLKHEAPSPNVKAWDELRAANRTTALARALGGGQRWIAGREEFRD